MPESDQAAGRCRAVIDRVEPAIDLGRFAIKRTRGDRLDLRADIFTDGHDEVRGLMLWRMAGQEDWEPIELRPVGNDRWEAGCSLDVVGRVEYTCEAWVDHFRSWHRDLKKRVAAGQEVRVDLEIGAQLVAAAAQRVADGQSPLVPAETYHSSVQRRSPLPKAPAASVRPDGVAAADVASLRDWCVVLRKASDGAARVAGPGGDQLAALMDRYPDRRLASRYHTLAAVVDTERARFSAWYEIVSPLDVGRAGPARHVSRLHRTAAVRGRDGL